MFSCLGIGSALSVLSHLILKYILGDRCYKHLHLLTTKLRPTESNLPKVTNKINGKFRIGTQTIRFHCPCSQTLITVGKIP